MPGHRRPRREKREAQRSRGGNGFHEPLVRT
jgi:hypothetical protein